MTGPLLMRAAHVVTITDLIWMHEVTGAAWPERLWRVVVPAVARRADRVLAISEAGRRDIVRLLDVPEDRIDVAVPGFGGGARRSCPRPDQLRAELELGNAPVVLSASAKKPYKNLMRLVEAWPLVLAQEPAGRLGLPGAPSPHEAELRARAEDLGVARSVRFLGFVDPEELESLYALAACFVFPSLREGFGSPILEAMPRLPVACSNATSLPEVAGDAALLFDPCAVDDIAACLRRLLDDPELRAELSQRGLRRSERFSWAATAAGTWASFDRAMRR